MSTKYIYPTNVSAMVILHYPNGEQKELPREAADIICYDFEWINAETIGDIKERRFLIRPQETEQ